MIHVRDQTPNPQIHRKLEQCTRPRKVGPANAIYTTVKSPPAPTNGALDLVAKTLPAVNPRHMCGDIPIHL